MTPKVIAIDGHSSTGKSSLSKKVALALGFIHVDTGAMYRAVAWYALDKNLLSSEGELLVDKLVESLDDINLKFELNPNSGNREIHLNGQNIEGEIRSMEVANLVSTVAKIPEIREHLVKLQRQMANEVGIVMDGRDIGSVVFPDAPVKIFLTASAKVRAQRRYDELRSNGVEITFDEVEENINSRDAIDTQRSASPLVKAEDAVEVNNDHMNQEETLQTVLKIIKEKGM
ncbi:(d)CMP kinase [Weeksellaceae bacterium KMM 9713]|uniref:Cytidylate kinase n=1 Tax=Profundicola chukchiensis TaxID=2961959 RepID=A0A9X4N0X0_9FLAO|nr:(d)CMP kinase [Profundicola chukchiensis]MDG4946877.1 (d)CMP kinase [Profundicola chukchiensis]